MPLSESEHNSALPLLTYARHKLLASQCCQEMCEISLLQYQLGWHHTQGSTVRMDHSVSAEVNDALYNLTASTALACSGFQVHLECFCNKLLRTAQSVAKPGMK